MSTAPSNLAAFIAEEVARQTSGDALEARVKKHIDEIVARSVDETFRHYSDNHKRIADAVKDALDIGKVDLPSYQGMVLGVLRSVVESNLSALVNEHLPKQVEEILNIAPKRMTLSAIVEEMKEHVVTQEGEEAAYGRSVVCEIEPSEAVDGYYRVKLDVESLTRNRITPRSAAVSFGVDRQGVIYSLMIDGFDMKHTVIMNRYPDWKKKIWGMLLCGTVIEIDEFNINRTIGDV